MSAPLSHKQKRYLSQLSDRAFARSADIPVGPNHADKNVSATDQRTLYRHTQVALACGKAGLRCCSQDDYKLVEAHFLALLGETVKAFNAGVRAATEPRRQAEAVLVRECERFGLRLSYAAAICRSVFKCSLEDASPNQLFKVMYTIRNRGHARQQKAAA
jgi:hypothetical protein